MKTAALNFKTAAYGRYLSMGKDPRPAAVFSFLSLGRWNDHLYRSL